MSEKGFCKRNYREAVNLVVEDRAEWVKEGIYSNKSTFVSPPVTLTAFATNILDYANTRKAYEQGGGSQLSAFTTSRKVLLDDLDILANYVDTISRGDKEIIKLAGFDATSDKVNTELK